MTFQDQSRWRQRLDVSDETNTIKRKETKKYIFIIQILLLFSTAIQPDTNVKQMLKSKIRNGKNNVWEQHG